MLVNFQDYILDNIENLKKFNNKVIVITDERFVNRFPKDVHIITAEDLYHDYEQYRNGICDTYRGGFWPLCKFRFNMIYLAMKKYNITNICHLENDVLMFKDLSTFTPHVNDKILLTIDAHNRCIPGIMFIPNYQLLEKSIEQFKDENNDMQDFYNIFANNDFCDTLPIFIEDETDETKKIITKNFSYYNCIFDAAAIGQYLGGIDPRNVPEDKPEWGGPGAFINETCVFDYSKYEFIWNESVPYVKINQKTIPIFNLHIHCKNLKQFTTDLF
jgi:hypothetical protein